MADMLSKLQAPAGANHRKKRVGRGIGSGLGKTGGKGQKGQRSRGRMGKRQFEGGQTTLQRRLPKRGFFNPFRKVIAVVNVGDLERFGDGAVVDETALRGHKLIKGRCDGVKVLGNGELTKALTVTLDAFSKAAVKKIEGAGGKVEKVDRSGPSVEEA